MVGKSTLYASLVQGFSIFETPKYDHARVKDPHPKI